MKQIGLFLVIFGTLITSGFCETPFTNVDIGIECMDAYYSFDFGTPQSFETLVTRKYFGFSSGRDTFVRHQIILTLRFHQEIVEGEYSFVDNKKSIIKVSGQVDINGTLMLQEILDDEHFRYVFRGKMTDQEIKGMWGLGNDLLESFEFFATQNEHSPWIKPPKLLNRSVSIAATDRNGNTNLHIAARHRQTQSVKYLLSLGSNANARNQEGKTPLHFVVDCEKRPFRETDIPAITEIVGLLLSHGAQVNVRDGKGVTALSIAQKNGLKQVAELLHKYGAEE